VATQCGQVGRLLGLGSLHAGIVAWSLASLVGVGLGGGCGNGVAPPEALTLSITSDALSDGAKLDGLRLLFRAGEMRFPTEVNGEEGNFPLGAALDPTTAPVRVAVDFQGTTFPTPVVDVAVAGLSDGVVRVRWEGTVDLSERRVLAVHLSLLTDACDVDHDGFPDCSVDGCCDGESVFNDCEDGYAAANPWSAPEDPCAPDPCDPNETVYDLNCDGVVPACADADGDHVSDTCGDCDPTNSAVGAGLPELCDGLDNDCDGETDEGILVDGQEIVLGETTCGLGVCAGGTYVCDEATSKPVCSTAGNAGPEIKDGLDNDCNGVPDDGIGDLDGDGFAATHLDGDPADKPLDCNDFDAGFFPAYEDAQGNPLPGAPEPCCPLELDGPGLGEQALAQCDRNCDEKITFCSPTDQDGDGVSPPSDCDDTDPMVYPDAPERCGDGVDQDCFGGDLPCDGLGDEDEDGWLPPDDCDDTNPDVNPGQTESCNGVDDDCDGLTDEGNPDTGTEEHPGNSAPCGQSTGECALGTTVCVNNDKMTGVVTCVGAINPVPERCDGKDNDCDGETDDADVFNWDGAAIGEACEGLGICGAGVVQCACPNPGEAECDDAAKVATCSTQPNGTSPQDQPEVCDNKDNDCDGAINEDLTSLADSTCHVQGVCANAPVSARCNEDDTGTWSCDYSDVPDFEGDHELTCDGKDNDCDGDTDEDFQVGLGCDGDDEDLCANGKLVCNAAGDGAVCDESGGTVPEICDGQDNDCDGETDEDFADVLGTPCDGPDTDQCQNGTFSCAPDGTATACDNESPVNIQEVCDGVDNDCDGETDEDFPLKGTACDGSDSDQCLNGTYTCTADHEGVECVNEDPTDIEDVCNTLDDDCDGTADQAYLPGGSVSYPGGPGVIDQGKGLGEPCGTGICSDGTIVCGPDERSLTCDSLKNALDHELCNDLDDTCDGQTDEGLGKGQPCDGDDADECANGTTVCDADPAAPVVCSETSGPDGEGYVELCNNENLQDEDCDGETDEDFVAGGTVTYDGHVMDGGDPNAADAGKVKGDGCGTGACSGGTVICDDTGLGLPCSTVGQASVEVCNDQDDDCDGAVDEDYVSGASAVYDGGPYKPDADKGKGASCGTGVCADGVVVCDGTDALTCSTLDQASSEVCNGVDDDCDGSTDEDLTAPPATKHVGVCTGQVKLCQGVGGWKDPDYALIGSDYEATEVSCDGLDNDCDGLTDMEDPDVQAAQPDTVNQKGVCAGAKKTCTGAGGWVSDYSGVTGYEATEASCDGLDNDCDGSTDEAWPTKGAACDGSDSDQCANGTWTCRADESGLECVNETVTGIAETCNGVDDDCDGDTDEAWPTKGAACDGSDSDQCANGTWTCKADESGLECVNETVTGIAETCNGLDDDCDGDTDEDNADCDPTSTTPICDNSLNPVACRGCTNDTECQGNLGAQYCVTLATSPAFGACAACNPATNAGCSPPTPVCVDGNPPSCMVAPTPPAFLWCFENESGGTATATQGTGDVTLNPLISSGSSFPTGNTNEPIQCQKLTPDKAMQGERFSTSTSAPPGGTLAAVQYFEVTLAGTGWTSLSFYDMRAHADSSPRKWALYYKADAGTWTKLAADPDVDHETHDTWTQNTVDISSLSATTQIAFRIVGFQAGPDSGPIDFDNLDWAIDSLKIQ